MAQARLTSSTSETRRVHQAAVPVRRGSGQKKKMQKQRGAKKGSLPPKHVADQDDSAREGPPTASVEPPLETGGPGLLDLADSSAALKVSSVLSLR
jgi:hypothetical protein